jgi:hypothetical protein
MQPQRHDQPGRAGTHDQNLVHPALLCAVHTLIAGRAFLPAPDQNFTTTCKQLLHKGFSGLSTAFWRFHPHPVWKSRRFLARTSLVNF